MSHAELAYVEERRSTRIDRSIPLMVHGADFSRTPYQEQVSTLTISSHGCKYQTRHQVLRGDVVVLEVNQSDNFASLVSSRARVKWLQPLATGDDPAFEVAVELEAPGNIWGVASPPQDWFGVAHPHQQLEANAASGPDSPDLLSQRSLSQLSLSQYPLAQESVSQQWLQVVTQPRNQMASFVQVMAGLGEQIQVMASEAATSVMLGEKNRLLERFSAELQQEAARSLESVIAASKDEMAERVWKELSEAHEAAAQAIYERWHGKMERETESASVRIATHGAEVSERVQNMAVATIERLQHNMDASRREAVDQCLTRLRSQLLPLLEEVQTAREQLAACEDELKVKSLMICKQFEDFMMQEAERTSATTQETLLASAKQFDESLNQRLTAASNELDKKSTSAIAESARALDDLSQDCERITEAQFQMLVRAATDQVNQELKDRTEQISKQCSAELEGYTRSHLDFISESIAEIAKKRAIRLRD